MMRVDTHEAKPCASTSPIVVPGSTRNTSPRCGGWSSSKTASALNRTIETYSDIEYASRRRSVFVRS